ncbi:MAG: precorrin-2 C(20)-methyltransferase [Spirochaetaceae bacterium]|jgi:precorrin-2/cobalt-factor-2 C20-methyltransferase|nr:precorrin-2 C(20)-methyltransferase [Spirochaetaceae bacterium]
MKDENSPAKPGTLYGIGVGPGDPELITVKALRIIAACDLVVFPEPEEAGTRHLAFEIARRAMPELEKREFMGLYLPMTRDAAVMRVNQEKAAQRIMEQLREGKNLAFLTLGDPSVYSTSGYLHRLVEEGGFSVRIIPGVTSFCAAAAALGEDLVRGSEALHLIPASGDTAEAMGLAGTRVFMKMGRSLGEIRALVEERGLGSRTRIVENCGLENQRIWKSLEELPPGEAPGYFTLIIVKDGERS